MKIYISNKIMIKAPPQNLVNILKKKFTLENPKWIENNNMGRWNGNTEKHLHFYTENETGSIEIPRGYARQLILLCRHHQIQYELEDNRRVFPELNFHFNGQLKDFQKKAADAMLAKEFGTLNAPTGSGKTVMALYMTEKRKQPTLILVHTKDLAFQWIERIETFLKIPQDDIGFIGSGKKSIGEKITVALVQSIYKITDEVAPHISHLIVDECHRAPSKTFTEAVSAFDAKYSLGLSATLFRRDRLSKLIFWYLGDKHHEVDKAQLLEAGDILSAEVVIRETEFKPFSDPSKNYSKMISELISDDKRNHLIASDIAKEIQESSGVCLVLSDRKKQCKTIQALLKYKYQTASELLTGDTGNSQRAEIIQKLNDGRINVLISTGQLIGEGFDADNLSTLFLTTPIKFSGRVLQYLGRILRPGPDKKIARVFDYVDVNVDLLRNSAKARQMVYKKQGGINKSSET